MVGYQQCGFAASIALIIVSELFDGIVGNLPLQSSSFQGNLRPQLTVTDSAGSSIQVVSNIANMAGDLPPKKRMKTKKLFKRLGQYFDPEWMSVDKPDNAVHQIIGVNASADKHLEQELAKVNFTMLYANGSSVSLDAAMLNALQNWMVQRASCPIHYVWVDLGERWWPRWLKTGVCVDDSPCSWPPGMHCVPAENKVLQLLRWHCRSRIYHKKKGWKKRFRLRSSDSSATAKNNLKLKKEKSKLGSAQSSNSQTEDLVRLLQSRRLKFRKNKQKCKWLLVPYPVTSECFCTC